MHHVAIMKKSWGFIGKILSGEKKIESRWYMNARPPFGKIKVKDLVYFKNSGEPVIAVATVSKVISFDDLTPNKVKQILDLYGKDIGIEKGNLPIFRESFKDKKYCVLVFLKKPSKVSPFNIDKRGFGAMSSWLCVDGIDLIKL